MNKKVPNNIFLEVGVKAFLYKKPGIYLVLQRSSSYPHEMKLKWDIPGGRIIPGEPTKQALQREITEEANLKIKKIIKILAVQDIMRVKDKHTVRITFLAECSGVVRINPSEHRDYKWMTLSGIQKLNHDMYLTPVIKEMIE